MQLSAKTNVSDSVIDPAMTLTDASRTPERLFVGNIFEAPGVTRGLLMHPMFEH
jgi:hypothetical protein